MYHFICRHRNDGLYDFVLFVLYSKQEIPKRAVQHRKFWCFNVPVVYFNLLFLLLFGTFWRTLGRSRTPDQKFARFFHCNPKRSFLSQHNLLCPADSCCLPCCCPALSRRTATSPSWTTLWTFQPSTNIEEGTVVNFSPAAPKTHANTMRPNNTPTHRAPVAPAILSTTWSTPWSMKLSTSTVCRKSAEPLCFGLPALPVHGTRPTTCQLIFK